MRGAVKLAAVSAALLAGTHGFYGWLQLEETAYLTVLSGLAAVLGILAAGRLWWSNCVESRLTTAAVALCTLLGLLLVTAVGLPGAGATDAPSWIEILLVALSCSTLLLLVLSSSRSRLEPRRGQHADQHRRHA
ncbi:hypothetical protein [Nesterenkonia sp. CF4.4]|uniref:hypothetical protein n=1 Tax=Nesterenkonia sp. CF4.4 TaxID=3373079 RepID=UPI003EE746F5